MSTLKVDTLQTTGGAGLYPAKAWINFNGTGTVAIRDSGNVSSITDNGAGDYTVNISSAFANTSVSCPSSAHYTGNYWMTSPRTRAITTSTVEHTAANVTGNAPVVVDASLNHVAVFGDLA